MTQPRVELLFWDGCPSHPQALEELRAAMAELGLDPDQVLRDQHARDRRDASADRTVLGPAADAVPVDTTGLSLEQVVEQIELLVTEAREIR